MVFDWLAAHWIGLLVGGVIWFVVWGAILIVSGAVSENDKGGWATIVFLVSIPCLWLTNVPIWAGAIGLVVALVQHFAG